jgi:hypothetical protein
MEDARFGTRIQYGFAACERSALSIEQTFG